ncbi:MAG: hypothetical protein QOE72_4247 [Chloroflexota bacterium]|jgi:hypothetical protein|nr:hypothetical protein [Chloroflexota bacterium]
MALIRWNPGTELMNLHSEMDRLFEELAGDRPPACGSTRGVLRPPAQPTILRGPVLPC